MLWKENTFKWYEFTLHGHALLCYYFRVGLKSLQHCLAFYKNFHLATLSFGKIHLYYVIETVVDERGAGADWATARGPQFLSR